MTPAAIDSSRELARIDRPSDSAASPRLEAVGGSFLLLSPKVDDVSTTTIPDPFGFASIPQPSEHDLSFDREEPKVADDDGKGVDLGFAVGGSPGLEAVDGGFFHRDLIRRPTPNVDPQVLALQRLGRKVGFRHLRRLFRSDLNDQFESDSTLDFFEYLRRREQIARLGRGSIEAEEVETESFVGSARASVLSNQRNRVERDIDLLQWGPLRVNDRGSLRFGFEKVRARQSTPVVQFARDEEQEKKQRPRGTSLFSDAYDIDSDLRFRPKVGALVKGEGFAEFLGTISATVEIDFMTEILSQRYMSTEFEISYDVDEEVAFFVNFVIYGNSR